MYLFLKVHMYLCISNCSCICFSICSCICISIYSCIRISRCFSVSFRTFNLMYNKLFKQIVEQQNVFFFLSFFFLLLSRLAPATSFCLLNSNRNVIFTKCAAHKIQKRLRLRRRRRWRRRWQRRNSGSCLCVASNKIFSKIHKFCVGFFFSSNSFWLKRAAQ